MIDRESDFNATASREMLACLKGRRTGRLNNDFAHNHILLCHAIRGAAGAWAARGGL